MTAWWSTEKINATISQEYIERELGSLKNREALHRVLKFGDGLTDDTYLDWILERSPRFFFILNDIGCPEKIFDIIDRSFDDEDLPLSQDGLWDLNLFGTKSETLDKKFYRQQFNFLVQELEAGGHVDYGVWDVVPVDPVLRRGQIASSQPSDKVYAHDNLYTRKKVPASGEDGVDRVHFMLHMRGVANIRHHHLVSVFATYAQDDFNYVLLTPSTELNLKQVFEDQSKQFKLLDKKDRRDIVLTWAHCITSALAYLHQHGFVHKGIRPSNIIVDQNNKVYLNDFAALKALDCEDTPSIYSGELYEHSPPENWRRKPTLHETAPLKSYLPGGGRTSRRIPKNGRKTPDLRPPPSPISSVVNRSNSRSASSSGSSTNNARPRNALITTFAPQRASTTSIIRKQFPADVFSMSTVLITLLSYLLGHSPKTFASHRCRINRQAGRGNAPPDASFHKNLKQVDTWMEKLVKEAGQKEKKDVKFWGAVVELVGVCRRGIGKEPSSRITAAELDKNVGGWVDWGLGRRRKCNCQDPDKPSSDKGTENSEEAPSKPRHEVRPPNQTSERISYINQTPARYWTTVSEDVSDAVPTARNSLATVGMETPRGRGSLAISNARNSFPSSGRNSFLRDSIASGTINSMSVHRHSKATTNTRRRSTSTEVWGLGEALKDDVEVAKPAMWEADEYVYGCEITPSQVVEEYMLEEVVEEDEGEEGDYDDDDEYSEDVEGEAANKDWPLPLGTLKFETKVPG